MMDTFESYDIETPQSSNIKALAWNADTRQLTVTFRHKHTSASGFGTTYDYADVSGVIAHGLKDAPSIGSYFAVMVRGNFASTKRPVAPEPEVNLEGSLRESLDRKVKS